jgi:hypothetical protein
VASSVVLPKFSIVMVTSIMLAQAIRARDYWMHNRIPAYLASTLRGIGKRDVTGV